MGPQVLVCHPWCQAVVGGTEYCSSSIEKVFIINEARVGN